MKLIKENVIGQNQYEVMVGIPCFVKVKIACDEDLGEAELQEIVEEMLDADVYPKNTLSFDFIGSNDYEADVELEHVDAELGAIDITLL